MTTYLVTALGWSLAGFLLGYALGRAVREVHEIKEAVVSKSPRTGSRPVRRIEVHQLIGALVVVLAVASVLVMAKQITDRQGEIECRADVLNETIEVLDQRAQLAGKDRAALDEFMSNVFSPDVDEESARRAYLKYTKRIARNADQRSDLTYPEDGCGR